MKKFELKLKDAISCVYRTLEISSTEGYNYSLSDDEIESVAKEFLFFMEFNNIKGIDRYLNNIRNNTLNGRMTKCKLEDKSMHILLDMYELEFLLGILYQHAFYYLLLQK
jgi:hypothetical protein